MSTPHVEDVQVRGRLRKKRADAGSVRLSDRDRELLRYVGEQCAITIDQLARLIGRSPRTGRWLRDRWRYAGWVESRKLTVDGPSFLWLTRTGARVAGSPFRTWRPNPTLTSHIEAVTEVRLLLEHERRLGVWVCERALAKTLCFKPTRAHLPDAVLEIGGARVAVEVELTLKSRARLETLLLELGHSYDQVWYFAGGAALRAVSELAAELPWQNVAVHPYPPRPNAVAS